MQLMTVTTKGQVTIPKNIREKLGLVPGNKVIFEDEGKETRLRPAPDFFSFGGALKGRRPDDKKLIHETVAADLAQRYLKTVKN